MMPVGVVIILGQMGKLIQLDGLLVKVIRQMQQLLLIQLMELDQVNQSILIVEIHIQETLRLFILSNIQMQPILQRPEQL